MPIRRTGTFALAFSNALQRICACCPTRMGTDMASGRYRRVNSTGRLSLRFSGKAPARFAHRRIGVGLAARRLPIGKRMTMPDEPLPEITSAQGTACAATPPQLSTFPNFCAFDGKSAIRSGGGDIRLEASFHQWALEEV
jgi:hypothetical protein